jgi:hypothetical protein
MGVDWRKGGLIFPQIINRLEPPHHERQKEMPAPEIYPPDSVDRFNLILLNFSTGFRNERRVEGEHDEHKFFDHHEIIVGISIPDPVYE